MENKNVYNDDVERIVNEPERQEAISTFYEKRQERKQKKILNNACLKLVLAVVFGLLGVSGLFVSWFAFPVMSVFGLCSAFSFGRYFENGKVFGWY